MVCRSKPVLQRIRQMFQCCMIWQTKPYPWRLFAKLNRYRFLQQPARVSFVCLRHLRHLLLLLQVSSALPQDLHTELLLSKVVGGAVSVKLKSWQNRVILNVVAEQDIERNMLALVRLCTTAGIQPPPPFESRYLSTVMCQYTGDSTQMFARVRCLKSKAHVYWSFDLREPFVPHEDLGPEAVGHYPQATPWNDDTSFNQAVSRRHGQRALESENARLKSQSSRSTRTDPTSNHPRRASTPTTRSAPPPNVEDPHDDEDGAETAPFRSPLPLDEHPFESPDGENAQDPGPTAAEDTYDQYLPKSDSVRFLESCNIEATTLKGRQH
eukprot:s5060_g3.t1